MSIAHRSRPPCPVGTRRSCNTTCATTTTAAAATTPSPTLCHTLNDAASCQTHDGCSWWEPPADGDDDPMPAVCESVAAESDSAACDNITVCSEVNSSTFVVNASVWLLSGTQNFPYWLPGSTLPLPEEGDCPATLPPTPTPTQFPTQAPTTSPPTTAGNNPGDTGAGENTGATGANANVSPSWAIVHPPHVTTGQPRRVAAGDVFTEAGGTFCPGGTDCSTLDDAASCQTHDGCSWWEPPVDGDDDPMPAICESVAQTAGTTGMHSGATTSVATTIGGGATSPPVADTCCRAPRTFCPAGLRSGARTADGCAICYPCSSRPDGCIAPSSAGVSPPPCGSSTPPTAPPTAPPPQIITMSFAGNLDAAARQQFTDEVAARTVAFYNARLVGNITAADIQNITLANVTATTFTVVIEFRAETVLDERGVDAVVEAAQDGASRVWTVGGEDYTWTGANSSTSVTTASDSGGDGGGLSGGAVAGVVIAVLVVVAVVAVLVKGSQQQDATGAPQQVTNPTYELADIANTDGEV